MEPWITKKVRNYLLLSASLTLVFATILASFIYSEGYFNFSNTDMHIVYYDIVNSIIPYLVFIIIGLVILIFSLNKVIDKINSEEDLDNIFNKTIANIVVVIILCFIILLFNSGLGLIASILIPIALIIAIVLADIAFELRRVKNNKLDLD